MSELTDLAANINLQPLGDRRSSGRAAPRVLYTEEDEKHEPSTQVPRPPRMANSRKNHKHQPADQFYTPSGAIMALLKCIGTYIFKVYTGKKLSHFFRNILIVFVYICRVWITTL